MNDKLQELIEELESDNEYITEKIGDYKSEIDKYNKTYRDNIKKINTLKSMMEVQEDEQR